MNQVDRNRGHQYPWKQEVTRMFRMLGQKDAALVELQQKLEAVLTQSQALQRRVFGLKSERLPRFEPVEKQLRPDPQDEARQEQGRARRRERKALRKAMRTQTVFHPVAPDQQRCPQCGNPKLDPLGEGKTTTQYEYVPRYFVRYEHVQEKLSCRCGEYIVTADPPP